MNTDLLRELCETPGVPGHEERVRDMIMGQIEGLFDEVVVDPMGSLLCRRDANKPDAPKIMLLCNWMKSGSSSVISTNRAIYFCNLSGGSIRATCFRAACWSARTMAISKAS